MTESKKSNLTSLSPDSPVFAVENPGLIPASPHQALLGEIPPSRMFLVKRSLEVFKKQYPGEAVYDASQGDGGASLPGVPAAILEQAYQLQLEHGSAYDQPFGTREFQRTVVEDYWGLESGLGLGPENVVAAVGGRDALSKAYQAMLALGHGRQGDALLVTRVPWISYNWGPYGVGANTLLAPGRADEGWAYTPDSIRASVQFAARSGRKTAGLVITSPDNPTGHTLSPQAQAELAQAALESGVAFVLFDWMYHYITDEEPIDLNAFLRQFDPQQRQRLIFMDGLTKSLGASNIRNAHLIAPENMAKFIVALASHGVIPHFFGQAVAIAAYRMGYRRASQGIVAPTNASRQVLAEFLKEQGLKAILGKGYYAFIHVGDWLQAQGWPDTERMGEYLATKFGLAVVPGVFFSPYGGEWIRFSYATPPDYTLAAAQRLVDGLNSLR